jgi:hypothetical protein
MNIYLFIINFDYKAVIILTYRYNRIFLKKF